MPDRSAPEDGAAGSGSAEPRVSAGPPPGAGGQPVVRRSFLGAAAALLGSSAVAEAAGAAVRRDEPLTLHTFGDSILDCGYYNEHGVHPGGLLVRNEDALFPEFRGRDLQARGPALLEHRARDGATVADLPRQLAGLRAAAGPALLTVGGNDLLRGLAADSGRGILAFEQALEAFVQALPLRPLLLGNVYDPTLGDDARNFTGIAPRLARANHRRINQAIASVAARHGRLVDLHAHFLRGDAGWFTRTIEPSLVGASEIRRAFLAALG